MTLRFGTDGVRGVANSELTPELVVALGRAAARVLGGDRFVVGRDPRLSGALLEAALSAGLAAEGVTVESLGVVPTPVVAWASAAERVPGAVISASHNPFADNGIKLFASGGRKLADDVEERLEAELDRLVHGGTGGTATGERVGSLVAAPEHALAYADEIVASVEGRDLAGLKVVVDCGNGAASVLAPYVLRRLGIDLTVVNAKPDGININAGCGSTDPSGLQRKVVEVGADAGIAFDGDADRLIAVDANGALVDGDHIIAICAADRHDRGRLTNDTVVVTVMTNLGFRLAMAERGVKVVETAVGDRYVLEALEAGGHQLGGEQSGHVIFSDLATTGDGLLTAVQLLDVVRRTGKPLAELASIMTRLPQVLRNVKVAPERKALDPAELLGPELAAVEAELGDHGRVLVRPSGTEPVVRVMVEATTPEAAEAAAARLVAVLEQ